MKTKHPTITDRTARKLQCILFAFSLFLGPIRPAQGGGPPPEQFWDGKGPFNDGVVQGGSGIWDGDGNVTNWTNAGGTLNSTWQSGGDAVFGGLQSGTVTTQNFPFFNSLHFTVTGYEIAGSGLPLFSAVITTDLGVAATISAELVDFSGPGGFTKDGDGTLILSGVNSYSGITTINAGVLSISSDANLGTAPGAPVANQLTFNGGTLQATASFDLAANRGITLLGGGGTIDVTGANTLSYAGSISGTGNLSNLTKVGTGTLVLGGSNSYTGTTFVNDGTLTLVSGVSTFNHVIIGPLIIGDDVGAANTATLIDTAPEAKIANDAPVTVNSDGLFEVDLGDLNGGEQVGPVVINRGNVRVEGSLLPGSLEMNGGLISGAGTILDFPNLTATSDASGNAATISVNVALSPNPTVLTVNDGPGSTDLLISGVISGGSAVGITKEGTGTLVLSGANTYTGITTINAGVLSISSDANLGTAPGAPVANQLTLNGGTLQATASFDLDTNRGITLLDGGGTIDVTGANTLSYAGSISGTGNLGNLTKVGTGTLTLSGRNSYTGTTFVNEGTLTLVGNASNQNQVINGPLIIGDDVGAANTAIVKDSGRNGTIKNSEPVMVNSDGLLQIDDVGRMDSGEQIGSLVINRGNVIVGNVSVMTSLVFDTLQMTGGSISGIGEIARNHLLTTPLLTATSDASGNPAMISSNVDLGTASKVLTINDGPGSTDLRISGVILPDPAATSPVGITKEGTGTLVLSGANTYDGATAINAGVLNIQNPTALGTTDAGTTVSSGATLQLQGGIIVGAEALTISGPGAAGQNGALVNVSGTNNYGGLLTLGAPSTISSDAGTLNLTNPGTITGAGFGLTLTGAGNGTISSIIGTRTGTLTKEGAGTWTLAGTNTYTGATAVNGGTLAAGAINTLPSRTALTVSTGATFDLNNFSQSIGSLAGAGRVTLGAATLTTGNDNTSTDFSGIISGTGDRLLGALIKVGTGTQTLSGQNTYTGPTAVGAGTLLVDGSLAAASAVTVNSGGTLGGTGTAAGAVTIANGGILAPGHNGPGTLTVGSLSLGNASLLNYQLGPPGVIVPGVNDLTIVRGNLTLDGILNTTALAGFGPGAYRLFNYGGALTNNTLDIGTVPPRFSASNFKIITGLPNEVDLLVLPLVASVQFWDGPHTTPNGVIDGGTGNWDNFTTNWTNEFGNNNSSWQNGMAVFAGTAGTVTVTQPIFFSGMEFMTNRYQIVAARGGSLNLIGSPTITTDDGFTATIDATINGAGGITKGGTGTLILGGANTYTGLTTVTAGTLAEGVNNAISTGDLTINGPTAIFDLGANHSDSVGIVTLDGGGSITGTGRSTLTSTGGFEMKSGTVSAILDGSVALNKTTAGTVTLTGLNTYTGATTVNGGSLIVDGSIASAQTFVNAGGLLGGGPAIAQAGRGIIGGDLTNNGSPTVSGIVSPGHSPGSTGTLTVNGNYTQNANGTLRIEIAGLAPADAHDLLAVNGTATLSGKLQLIPLNNFQFSSGEPLTFLTANGGVNGTFNPIEPFVVSGRIVAIQIVYNPNSVGLEATPISPEKTTAIFSSGVAVANVQTTNLERRMERIRAGSRGFSREDFTINSGVHEFSMGLAGPTGPEGKSGQSVMQPTPDNRWGVFVTGLGEFTDVDSTNVARGYYLSTGGLTFGADYRVSPNFAIGLIGGYAHTNGDLGDNGNLDVNGGTVGVYATGWSGGFYVDTAVTGGFNSYDTHRSELLRTVSGNTDGRNFNALVAAGYDWKSGGLTIGPVASYQYTYVEFDEFTEHGSLVPLSFPDQNTDSSRTALGARASYDWHVGHVLIRPEIRASWQHEFGDSEYSIVANFANGTGNSFTVNGPAIGRDSLLLGAGAAVLLNDRVTVYAYYDGELARTNYSSNSVSGGFRITF